MFITSQLYVPRSLLSPDSTAATLDSLRKALRALYWFDGKENAIRIAEDGEAITAQPNGKSATDREKLEIYQSGGWQKILLPSGLLMPFQYGTINLLSAIKTFGAGEVLGRRIVQKRPDVALAAQLSLDLKNVVVCLATFDYGSGQDYEAWLIVNGVIRDVKFYRFGDTCRQSANLTNFSLWRNFFPSIHGWEKLESTHTSEKKAELFLQRYPLKSRLLMLLSTEEVDSEKETPVATVPVTYSIPYQEKFSPRRQRPSPATLLGIVLGVIVFLAVLFFIDPSIVVISAIILVVGSFLYLKFNE